jgi:hypothetical protein
VRKNWKDGRMGAVPGVYVSLKELMALEFKAAGLTFSPDSGAGVSSPAGIRLGCAGED